MKKVTFQSNGIEVVGHLYLPTNVSRPSPAVPLLGPMTFQKEQVPTEYAKRLAASGYVALVFDPRYHGESGGIPRRWEHPLAKVADVSAAIDYLVTLPEVDASRVHAMAICQGSSEMIRAAADDDRIRSLVTVAGHYRDHDADREWLGAQGVESRLERGWAAKLKFASTGEADYVPAIDPERMDVGMPGKFVWDWYSAWTERGLYENRYAVMSDADLLTYESLSAASRLKKPYLMVHSDNSFLPNAARRHFATVPAAEKSLAWEGETSHFQYYDDAAVIDRTAAKAVDWFSTHEG